VVFRAAMMQHSDWTFYAPLVTDKGLELRVWKERKGYMVE